MYWSSSPRGVRGDEGTGHVQSDIKGHGAGLWQHSLPESKPGYQVADT